MKARDLKAGMWVRVNIADAPDQEPVWVVRKVEFHRVVAEAVDIVVEYFPPMTIMAETNVEVVK